jgi:hypothetical protein
MVSELSTRFSFFAELTFTATPDEYKTEVERMIIKFNHSDYFKIGAGRFHTAISWWNTAYHHGAWLQTTIERPVAVRFGSQFLPIHFVGIAVDGAIPSGGLGLNYIAGVGNGRNENVARAGDSGDVNNDRALNLRIFARPNSPYGLEAGVSYYRDTITKTSLTEDYDEWIANAYVVYSRENPEVIAEYFRLEHTGVITGEKFQGEAYYIQVAYRLPWWKALMKPYARYEHTDVDENDPVFTKESDLKRMLVGARFDVASFVALKGEFRRDRVGSGSYGDGFLAQAAFTF